MSLLWSDRIKKKLLTYHTKPSPTYQSNSLDSARNPRNFQNGAKRRKSTKCYSIEGSSLFTCLSGSVRASMTVEASIVLPLFMFFFLNLGSAIEMIRLHGNLQLALWEVGSELSLYDYVLDDGMVIASALIKAQLAEEAGGEYLEESPLTNGTDSLMLWESDIFGTEDVVDLIVTYSVSPICNLVSFPSFRMANRYYAHSWTGYQLPGEEAEIRLYYVAENGEVYHLDRNCTHLRLTIRSVAGELVSAERNRYGQRYGPCDKCVKGMEPEVFFIADAGDKYHYIVMCPGLKRTVFAVSEEEAKKYRKCSRCGNTDG